MAEYDIDTTSTGNAASHREKDLDNLDTKPVKIKTESVYECQGCLSVFLEPSHLEMHFENCSGSVNKKRCRILSESEVDDGMIVLSSEDECDDELEIVFNEDDKSLVSEELKKILGAQLDDEEEASSRDYYTYCSVCKNGRKMTKKQLARHYKRHENLLVNLSSDTKRLYYCHVCKNSAGMTRDELRSHHESMHGLDIPDKKQFFRKAMSKRPRSPRPEIFRCEICSKELTDQKSLDDHLNGHDDQYSCDTCGARFKKLIDYTLHLQIHDKDQLFKCLLCPFETTRRHLVKSHLYSVHEQFKKYKCETCQKGFAIFTHFQEHKYYHTGEKPFVCDICGQRFMYTRYLNSHKVQMHRSESKNVECKICHKTYSHRNSLHTHMKSHTGSVSICDVCGKTLSSNEKLRLHYRIHTGEKPYKCDFCDKTFKTRSYCVEHERVHTGEKPYHCSFCGKSFSQRTSMMIHTRGHTGEKPYVCHLCSKAFAAKSMVNVHLKSCLGGAPRIKRAKQPRVIV